jgi:hypothetical protein
MKIIMTNKNKIVIWSIGTICVVVGIVYVYPLITPLFVSKVVDEAPLVSMVSISGDMQVVGTSATTSPSFIWKGSFVGFDKLHNGTGTAHITQTPTGRYILRFESDFKVTNGPDLYVGFGKDGTYIEGSEIAVLKGNIGSQNYEVNKIFDILNQNEVWIWCKRFSEPFARAVLK